jgi:hypothetical protein
MKVRRSDAMTDLIEARAADLEDLRQDIESSGLEI